MLFVDEFCGILVYIKFGADVTSQYDDKFTITFNTGDEEVTITEVMLSEIEEELSGNSLCFLKNKVHQ